jgi:hypothetical protein
MGERSPRRLLIIRANSVIKRRVHASAEPGTWLGRKLHQLDGHGRALLHKSIDGRGSPFPGRTHPTTSVIGVPSAVKPFSKATRIWTSAT